MTLVRYISKINKNGSRVAMALVIGLAGLLTSCAPKTDIAPVVTAPANTITVKVKDMSGATLDRVPARHLTILAAGTVVLDKDITGDFKYSFACTKPDMKITATLTASTAFINSLEIDVNNQMHAYHNGSCSVKEFDITDTMSF